jgi:hypothetical protein
VRPSPDLPPQTFWGFNLGGEDLGSDPAISPGPVIVTRYDRPALVRRFNQLPAPEDNGGFGVPEVTTHLHNFHSASDSDGGPCNPTQQRFFFRGQYYDYFYNMKRAGWDSGFGPDGDLRETLSGLWYHDHRVDHTAENVYKGLAGFHLMFSEADTGDESTGLHLPSFPSSTSRSSSPTRSSRPTPACWRSTRSTSTASSATGSWSTASTSRSSRCRSAATASACWTAGRPASTSSS